MNNRGSLLIVRHGVAQQERIDSESLTNLPHDEFRARIWEHNLRQSLTEEGRQQARRLGSFLLTQVAVDNPLIVVGRTGATRKRHKP